MVKIKGWHFLAMNITGFLIIIMQSNNCIGMDCSCKLQSSLYISRSPLQQSDRQHMFFSSSFSSVWSNFIKLKTPDHWGVNVLVVQSVWVLFG